MLGVLPMGVENAEEGSGGLWRGLVSVFRKSLVSTNVPNRKGKN